LSISLNSIQRSKSLYEQTYDALRTSILTGDLEPGARLVETQLAEQLQVSRTPIREAIRQLQRDNLVTADANGSLRVTTISIADVAQLYDCRIALEQLSVEAACQNATALQLRRLEDLVSQAEHLQTQPWAQSARSPRSSSYLLDLDYQFHHTIAESSQNRWLVTLLEQVFDQMTLLRVQTTRHNPRVLEIRLEHRQIFTAIAQRDVVASVDAIRSHLIASKARVIQEVKNLHVAIGDSEAGD
jgi:DNA-binding GntR family transcriptional regulator